MDINYLDIQIIDTQENDLELALENAAVNSIKLIYNGQEDKFANIITSELHFSFLVKNSSTDSFLHLYTGSETRYKVKLIDVSVVDYPKTIWQGFLLAEQFNEPYKSGNFFINLIATDRLALLKNIEVAVDGGSVMQFITNALFLTGLDLKVSFSEALQNTGFNVDYLDVIVKDKTSNAASLYTFLEAVLKSIGCVLFLFKDNWYIIGLNKFKERVLDFKIYNRDTILSTVLVDAVSYNRPVLKPVFVEAPEVSILSPLKKVSLNWDAGNLEELLPENVVSGFKINDVVNPVRLNEVWELKTNKDIELKTWLKLYDPKLNRDIVDLGLSFNGIDLYNYNNKVLDVVEGPYVSINSLYKLNQFNPANYPATVADLDNNYIVLQEPFYVSGSTDLDRSATLKIEFFSERELVGNPVSDQDIKDYVAIAGDVTAVSSGGSGVSNVQSVAHDLTTGDYVEITDTYYYDGVYQVTVIDVDNFSIVKSYVDTRIGKFKIKPFAGNFFAAITRKEFKNQLDTEATIVFSNLNDINPFFFNITYTNNRIVGVLDLGNLILEQSGWYNVRLYPELNNPLLGHEVVFKTCSFKLKESDAKVVVKNRDIDYTTSHDLDISYAASKSNLVKKGFIFSDALKTQFSLGNVVSNEFPVTTVSYSSRVVTSNNNPFYREIKITINAIDYSRLQGVYDLYVIKNGTTTPVLLAAENYFLQEDAVGDKLIYQLDFTPTTTTTNIEQADALLLKNSGLSGQDYAEYWLDKWKRYDVDESLQMQEALACVYHDLLSDKNYLVSGSILGLVSPLELLSFQFRGDRLFYPLSLEMNLNSNVTDIVMVESKNENVTDYE